MTPEEAIYFLKGIQNKNADYSMEEAISVIKEIQQYRLIKDATIGEIAEALKEYSEIGTVEECREAREKQIPKAPEMKPYYEDMPDEEYLCCPTCGDILTDRIPYDNKNFYFHCLNCGQRFDWDKKDD